MNKKIFLCGHTGSVNRGCQAIVISTVTLLKKIFGEDIEIITMTFDKKNDIRLGLNKFTPLFSYKYNNFFCRLKNFIIKKIFRNNLNIIKNEYKKYYKFMNTLDNNNTLVFNIGGDIYCYDTPYLSYALNDITLNKNIDNVFFGCSVSDSVLNDINMQKDINKYSYIVTRETKTFNLLKKFTDGSKISLACDPAFWLPCSKVVLPKIFNKNNVIGINVSPLIFNNSKNIDDLMYKNVFNLLDYIINETSYNVCLIPHVYDVNKNTEDIFVLKNIFNKYKNFQDRICLIDTEYDCTELKYIISQCKFFIGARTHSTIAAYSSKIPTLVLSYSIKSRGIVKDLYNDEEKYLLDWRKITSVNDLLNKFKILVRDENIIKKFYDKNLEIYKNTIIEELNIIKGKLK